MNRTPVNIGRQTQLFFDNWIIEMTHYTTRKLHQPERCPEPILKKDRPWEVLPHFRSSTWNVCFDSQEDLYKCWYEDMGWDYEGWMGRSPNSDSNKPYPQTLNNRYLYAESKDGISWEKPELDYRQMDSQKTNICLGNEEIGKVHCCSVLQDPIDKDPRKRFKALFWGMRNNAIGQFTAAYSADGRKWTLYDEPVKIGVQSGHVTGDVLNLQADPASGEYWLDTRSPIVVERFLKPRNPYPACYTAFPQYPSDPWRITVRNISSTLSDNILQWPEMRQMLIPDDEDDNLDFDYNGLVRFRVGDLWLAFVSVLRRVANTVEIHLMYSRDGFNWKRTGEHDPFMPPRGEGFWDAYMTETSCPPMMVAEEMRIYYAGANVHHDIWSFGEKEGLKHPEVGPGWGGGRTALGLARMRPDGFVSLDADIRHGIVITRPFVSDGEKLIVNAECGEEGYLEVELVDANDDTVTGYERADCDTFTGDCCKHVVTWKGKGQLPRDVIAAGAKLRFYNKKCSLYSFTIAKK